MVQTWYSLIEEGFAPSYTVIDFFTRIDAQVMHSFAALPLAMWLRMRGGPGPSRSPVG